MPATTEREKSRDSGWDRAKKKSPDSTSTHADRDPEEKGHLKKEGVVA